MRAPREEGRPGAKTNGDVKDNRAARACTSGLLCTLQRDLDACPTAALPRRKEEFQRRLLEAVKVLDGIR